MATLAAQRRSADQLLNQLNRLAEQINRDEEEGYDTSADRRKYATAMVQYRRLTADIQARTTKKKAVWGKVLSFARSAGSVAQAALQAKAEKSSVRGLSGYELRELR